MDIEVVADVDWVGRARSTRLTCLVSARSSALACSSLSSSCSMNQSAKGSSWLLACLSRLVTPM